MPTNTEKQKFCCIALESTGSELKDSGVEIASGISIHQGSPFKLDQHWLEWLGTIRCDRLHKSEFVILATALSEKPGVLDDENEDLEQKAFKFLYGLFLQGIPFMDGGLVVSGSLIAGEASARSVSDLPEFYRVQDVFPRHITNAAIQNAPSLAAGIHKVFSTDGMFDRTKKGFNAWTKGAQELSENRLHQFVRSVEALILPDAGANQRQFAHRCQTFIKPSNQARDLLLEIYDLRSATEHMNGWQDFLTHIPRNELEHYATFRIYQAELLASKVYSRLLADPTLLRYFETDDTIRQFWALPDHERKKIWGEEFDLEVSSRAAFQPPDY